MTIKLLSTVKSIVLCINLVIGKFVVGIMVDMTAIPGNREFAIILIRLIYSALSVHGTCNMMTSFFARSRKEIMIKYIK